MIIGSKYKEGLKRAVVAELERSLGIRVTSEDDLKAASARYISEVEFKVSAVPGKFDGVRFSCYRCERTAGIPHIVSLESPGITEYFAFHPECIVMEISGYSLRGFMAKSIETKA